MTLKEFCEATELDDTIDIHIFCSNEGIPFYRKSSYCIETFGDYVIDCITVVDDDRRNAEAAKTGDPEKYHVYELMIKMQPVKAERS